jgi:cleavage and polyadenylation specificity factor subunit 3
VTSTAHPHSHGHSHHSHDGSIKDRGTAATAAEFQDLHLFLSSHFGNVTQSILKGDEDDLLTMDVTVDGVKARLDLITMRVDSESADLKRRVEGVVEMALATMKPLSRAFVGQGLDVVRNSEIAQV